MPVSACMPTHQASWRATLDRPSVPRRCLGRTAALASGDVSHHAVSPSDNSSRRSILLSGAALSAALAALATPLRATAAVAPAVPVEPITAAEVASSSSGGPTASTYHDPVDNFELQVPNSWVFGSGEATGGSGYAGATGARRTLVWYPKEAAGGPRNVNISIVVTNVSGEFTRLGSFGTANTFGTNLVNSMDQSFRLRAPAWARGDGPIQVARLLEADETPEGNYFVEYFVDNPAEGQKHLLSLVSLGNNGRYNRLYTLTAQCPEQELSTYRSTMDQVLRSFVPPARQARRV